MAVPKPETKSQALARINRFIETEKRIPQLPQILLRVESALDDQETGGDRLARVILEDPALTAQVLKVANSTFYNPGGNRITTISRAIVILGFENIRRLVLGLSVSRMFTLLPRWKVYRRLWRHSLATALLARDLAREDGAEDVEVVFVAGLLHDVGKFILGHLHSEEYADLLEKAFNEADFDLCGAEHHLFSCNHQEVGALLARVWGLPFDLERVIGRHRPGHEWRYFSEVYPGLGAYVIMADQLARLLDLPMAERQASAGGLFHRLETFFGFDEKACLDLLDNLEDEITTTAADLDIALDDLRLDDKRPSHGHLPVREVDADALLNLTLKLSEQALLQLSLGAYLENTAAALHGALGLEAMLVYLPGSKGRGLAPAFCFGGGVPAEVLSRLVVAYDNGCIVNRVFASGKAASAGAPPPGAEELMATGYWQDGHFLAVPMLAGQGERSSITGVLLCLRNQRTIVFSRDEQRLLQLYAGFLASRS